MERSDDGIVLHADAPREAPTVRGFVSLLTTSLFGVAAKLETGKLLAGIGKIDARALARLSVREWLARDVKQPEVRLLIEALFRVSTYANDPERLSAGLALEQLQMALAGGVWYLDGGWRTLVDGLRAAAEAAGAEIVTGAKIEAVEHDGRVKAVRLADGARLTAASVIIAAGPSDACALVERGDETALGAWARAAIPVKAACLEIALRRLPQPRATFALGIDKPLYLSVHSATAKLAPAAGALLHVAKYCGAEGDPKANRELEELLDQVQPGWRDEVVERRFLPSITVVHALPTAAGGGLAGRPGPTVPGIDGLYVAGDWVGPEGWLADAALASAKRAAEMIVNGRRHYAVAA